MLQEVSVDTSASEIPEKRRTLREVTEEQLAFLHTLQLRGFNLAESCRRMWAEYPDTKKKYRLEVYGKYLRSDEGKERGRAVLESFRERGLEVALAQPGGRLVWMQEMAERLFAKLRAAYGDTADITEKQLTVAEICNLNGELRQTLAAIRTETEPLGAPADGFLSPAQEFWARLAAGAQGAPGPVRRLIAEESPRAVAQTIEVEAPAEEPS